MRFRILVLSIVIVAVLMPPIVPFVRAQNVFVTVPAPKGSAPNQMIDFYAGGSNGGYSIRVSPQGGTFTISDQSMNLMPWGYVTAQWSLGKVYIIFLVNVTQTNFRIGFLYLTNSSADEVILRLFDYNDDTINLYDFSGAQHVFNRTVSTGKVQLPKLQFPIPTVPMNNMYALGPQLYLSSLTGAWVNGTSLLQVHPVLNQLFNGPSDYNEVWSLLSDAAGNYYFAILYMQNNDPSHVIIEHQLRLNDYKRLNGQTVNAKWSKGSFENSVTVRTPASDLTVKIDGFPFQTNSNGMAFTNVPSGSVTVEVPTEITSSNNAKVRFTGWNGYGMSNPLTIKVNSTLDITANYAQQYQLLVNSPYGNPQGSGWYVSGANATFSVQSTVNYTNATRRVFQRWAGDSNSTSNQSWAIINSPKQINALWKTQYQVTVGTSGLPTNLTASVVIGNAPIALNGPASYVQWADANQPLPISVQSMEIQSSASNYVLTQLLSNNKPFTGSVTVSAPLTILLVYTEKPKSAVALDLHVFPTVAAPGLPISITGSINGANSASATVVLQYSSANGSWHDLATVPTSGNGAFAYTWNPTAAGEYSIKAFWSGDSTHSPASNVVKMRVVDSSTPSGSSSDPVSQLLQVSLSTAKSIPYVSTLAGLAGSLITLGYVLAGFVFPTGPSILGNLIGSLFVGFVFVFPISAAAVMVKSARSKRRPSLLWLIPLFVVWLSSLGLVLFGFSSAGPSDWSIAAQLLLVLSNVFAIPLLAAFRLARIVT